MHTLLLEALCADCYNLGDAVEKGKANSQSLQLSDECVHVQYISMHVLDLIMIGNKPTQLRIIYTKLQQR